MNTPKFIAKVYQTQHVEPQLQFKEFRSFWLLQAIHLLITYIYLSHQWQTSADCFTLNGSIHIHIQSVWTSLKDHYFNALQNSPTTVWSSTTLNAKELWPSPNKTRIFNKINAAILSLAYMNISRCRMTSIFAQKYQIFPLNKQNPSFTGGCRNKVAAGDRSREKNDWCTHPVGMVMWHLPRCSLWLYPPNLRRI